MSSSAKKKIKRLFSPPLSLALFLSPSPSPYAPSRPPLSQASWRVSLSLCSLCFLSISRFWPPSAHLCISVFFDWFEGFIIVNLTPNNNKRRWVLNEIAFVKSIIFSSVSLWSLSLALLLYMRMRELVIINFFQLKMVIPRVSFWFKFTVK